MRYITAAISSSCQKPMTRVSFIQLNPILDISLRGFSLSSSGQAHSFPHDVLPKRGSDTEENPRSFLLLLECMRELSPSPAVARISEEMHIMLFPFKDKREIHNGPYHRYIME
jgi:hypothetical protein